MKKFFLFKLILCFRIKKILKILCYFKIDNFNVIIVGWGNGATFPYYNNASTNIRLVGRELGLMINAIADTFYQTDPQMFRIHCIGHSLGSNFLLKKFSC